MTYPLARQLPLLLIDIGVGLVGFLLSIGWGRATRSKMTSDTVRLLAFAWAGIAVFGIIMAFVM